MSAKVEHIPKDIYGKGFLCDVTFDPPEQRGTVLGIMGRLLNEPAIKEGDPRPGPDFYKGGVTPDERLVYLEKLWRILRPVAGCDEAKPLFEAVACELSEDWGVDMVALIAAEEKAAAEAAAMRERDRLRREAERKREAEEALALAAIKEEEAREATDEATEEATEEAEYVGYISIEECIANGTHLTDCDDDGYCNFCGHQEAEIDDFPEDEDEDIPEPPDVNNESPLCSCGEPTCMGQCGNPTVNDAPPADDSFEAFMDNDEEEEETFDCELCGKPFPLAECNEFEGACICAACKEEFVKQE